MPRNPRSSMSEKLRSRLSLVVTGLLLGFVTFGLVTADPPAVDRAQQIGSVVRCPVCNGESIADSPAPLARDMMAVVHSGIDSGLSDEQIIDGLLASYTNSQRLDPELSAATVALWAIPGAALIIGAILVVGQQRAKPASSNRAAPSLSETAAEDA